MHLLTIARQANLGDSLKARIEQAKNHLEIGCGYRRSIDDSVNLNVEQNRFHQSTYLIGLFSLVEALVYDLGLQYLICFPGHLSSKNITIDLLGKTGSVGKTVEELANRELNGKNYARFDVFVQYVVSLLNKKANLDFELLSDVCEIKATRDVYVHAGGRVNSIYLLKSRDRARCNQIGNDLPLGSEYMVKIEALLQDFIVELENVIPKRLLTCGRATTFKAMWEATCLAKLVPFDDGWAMEGEDMVRPKEKVMEWLWSDSEKALLNFFISIYNENYPGRDNDMMTAVRRWSPDTDEGKVMMSWFDSPFWF